MKCFIKIEGGNFHMKKKRVSLLGLIMVVMLSITLAACGGGNSNVAQSESPSESPSDSPSASASETVSESPSADAGPKIEGDFEIQYFVGGYGDAWWKSQLKQFGEKYPDLKIKESAGPKINAQMKPRWIQGDPPDLIFIDGAEGLDVPTAIKDGQLLDITDWYKTAQNVEGELITDLLIAPSTPVDGRVYNIPMVFGSWGTFYDKALFTKNGWEVPTDFDSLLAVSEVIKASGTHPYVYTGVHVGYLVGGFVNPAIVSANGDNPQILQDMADLKEGVFSTPPVRAALQQVVTMRDKGYFDPASAALNHTDSQMTFLQHKDAFIPNGLWVENEMKNDKPADFEFGYIPSVTQAPGGKYIANPYTTLIAVAAKAKNPEAAKAFIQFIYTKKAAVEWAESTGAILNVKAGAEVEASNASSITKGALKYFSDPNLVVLPPVSGTNADVNKEIENATLALATDSKVTIEQWIERVEKAAAKARK
jgi:N-acetylglucosamine transport system substrate-binding protein